LIIECCKTTQDHTTIQKLINSIENWDTFIDLAYEHGIFPLVFKTLKQHNSLLKEDLFQELQSINIDIVKENMMMTLELTKITKLLDENGIKAISIKGPVLSQLAYGDIALRQYTDLDILVQKADLKKVYLILSKYDYTSKYPKSFFDSDKCINVEKDVTLINNKKDISVEIHWELFEKKYNMFSQLIVNENLQSISINNNVISTLSNEVYLQYLSIHGSKHMWERIEWIKDIDLLIRTQNIDIDNLPSLNNKAVLLGLYMTNKIFNTPLSTKIVSLIQNQSLDALFEKIVENIWQTNLSDEAKDFELKKFHYSLSNNSYEKLLFLYGYIFKTQTVDCQEYYENNEKIGIIFMKPLRLIKKIFNRIFK